MKTYNNNNVLTTYTSYTYTTISIQKEEFDNILKEKTTEGSIILLSIFIIFLLEGFILKTVILIFF